MRTSIKAVMLAGILVAGPALANGPGRYGVEGKSPDGNSYEGSASLAQTGDGTWRISWAIGSEKYEGYAIGDKEVLSVMFTSSGRSGVALYVSDEKTAAITACGRFAATRGSARKSCGPDRARRQARRSELLSASSASQT
jgi:hypothetical protein